MAQTINIPGQGDVDFPDNMSEDQIRAVIKKHYPVVRDGKMFDVAGARKEGYSDSEIAEYLSKENRFDLQGARKEGYSDSEIVDHLSGLGKPQAKQRPPGTLHAPQALAASVLSPVVSGLAGLGAAATKAVGLTQKDPGDVVRDVSGFLESSLPKPSPATEAAGAVAGYLPRKLGEAADAAGGAVTDLTGSPALGTAANVAVQAAPAVLGRVATAPVRSLAESGEASLAAARSRNLVKDTTLSQARQAGYVLPPSQANPGLLNNLVEGFAGKVKTAQKASMKNQETTNALARKALGLSEEAPLTPDTLQAVRQQAGKAYERIKNTGRITADKEYFDALDAIKKPYEQAAKDFPRAANRDVIKTIDAMKRKEFDSASAVDQISNLREMADKAFKSGDNTLGRATKKAAEALEGQIERHLQNREVPAVRETGKINQTTPRGMLGEFRHAREIIAKSYSVQAALNEGSGNVSAQALARQLKKGKPMSGELGVAARTSREFPKATQDPATIGSPTSVSLLDLGLGGAGYALMHEPTYAALAMSRPLLRAGLLTGPAQEMMATPQYQLGVGLRAVKGATQTAREAGLALPAFEDNK